MRRYLWLGLMVLGLIKVGEVMAFIGKINGYLTPATQTISVGSETSVKVMIDAGTNKVSLVNLVLNVGSKLKVKSVTVNKTNFPGVFKEEATGGTVSIYGLNSSTSSKLPTGKIEVATLVLSGVSAGSAEIGMTTYEIAGPSTNSETNYELVWQKGNFQVESVVVTPTVTPTPIVTDGKTGILKMKLAFGGVSPQSMCANWPLTVTVLAPGNVSKTYNNVVLSKDTSRNDILVVSGAIKLDGISSLSKLAVFVKGPKHIQMKYGENGQSGFYNKEGGEVTVTADPNTTPEYDFTGYPIMGGDVLGTTSGGQDGKVDGRDFSYIKSEVQKRTEVAAGGNMKADLNGNCKLESLDLVNLMLSLKEKQEQLY